MRMIGLVSNRLGKITGVKKYRTRINRALKLRNEAARWNDKGDMSKAVATFYIEATAKEFRTIFQLFSYRSTSCIRRFGVQSIHLEDGDMNAVTD
jgi:hypothetical protein